MNNNVAVQGTGIVDVITLGDSEISWNAGDYKIYNASIALEGDLEVILNRRAIKAHSFQSERTEPHFNEPARFLLELHTVKDNYVMSIGQLKRYFHEQIPFGFSIEAVQSWDDIFSRAVQRQRLIPDVTKFGIGAISDDFRFDERKLTKLVRQLIPYWAMPEDNMMVLGTLEPLNLIPKDITAVKVTMDGSMDNHNNLFGAIGTNIILDGTKYRAQSGFTVNGKASGRMYLSEPLSAQFPVSIHADYAKIGTGDLNLQRTERDGQVMVISSRTSEELRDCTIDVRTEPTNPAYEEKVRHLETRMESSRFKKSAYEAFEGVAGLGLFGGLIANDGMIAAAGFGLAGLGYLLGKSERGNIERLEALAKIEKLNAAAKLHVTYSGLQTSRWLDEHPQYREFARRISTTQPL